MDQVALGIGGGRLGTSLADEQGQAGGEQRERGGARPGESETGEIDQSRAEQWSEGDAQVEPEGVVRQRLAHSCLGCEVGECSEAGDEERRLGDSREQAQRHDHGKALGEEQQCEAGGRDEGAAEEQRQATEAVGEAPGDGPQDERRQGECPDGETGAGGVAADGAGDVQGEREDRDAEGGEVAQFGDAEHDERRGEQALRRRAARHGSPRMIECDGSRPTTTSAYASDERAAQAGIAGVQRKSRERCGADTVSDSNRSAMRLVTPSAVRSRMPRTIIAGASRAMRR